MFFLYSQMCITELDGWLDRLGVYRQVEGKYHVPVWDFG